MSLENENRRLRVRVAELEEELRQLRDDLRPAAEPPPRWRLTASEWRLLWVLYKVEGLVTYERVGSLFYEGDCERSRDALPVFMMRLRRKLTAARLGITIETRFGQGWVMPDVSRANMAEALDVDAEPVPDPLPAPVSGKLQHSTGRPYEELRFEARAMRAKRKSLPEISARLDISVQTAWNWVHDMPEHAAASRDNRTRGRQAYAARRSAQLEARQ